MGALGSIDSVPRSKPEPTQVTLLADLAAMVMEAMRRHRHPMKNETSRDLPSKSVVLLE